MQMTLGLNLISQPASPADPEERVDDISIRDAFRTNVFIYPNEKNGWYLQRDKYWDWDEAIAAGKSYMVGNIPTNEYLATHSSPLSRWQKLAYTYALQNPDRVLNVETKTHVWRVYQRGEYVEFALPYQDKGGERHYISRDGRTKVLVNVD